MSKMLKTMVLLLSCGLVTLSSQAGQDCTTTINGGTVAGETFTASQSPICVTGDLSLSLVTFEAGTTVLVDGPYAINILTTINVAGTSDAPVTFTAFDESVRWKGLKFTNTPPGSFLRFCDISLSDDSGLTLTNSVISIDHCNVHDNQGQNGAGIRIDLNQANQEMTILDTTIVDNVAAPGVVNCLSQGPGIGSGGGIYVNVTAGKVRLVGNRILRNKAGNIGVNGIRSGAGVYAIGSVDIDNTLIANNSVHSGGCPCLPAAIVRTAPGAGIYASGDIVLSNSIVRENHSSASVCFTGSGVATGPAIYFDGGFLSVQNTTIDGNTTSGNGPANTLDEQSAVVIADGIATVNQSTIVGNLSSAVYQKPSGAVDVTNSIVYFNGNNQLAGRVTSSFSNIEGGTGVDTNIDFNPALSTRYDRPIVLGSPSTDTGNPNAEYNDLCFPPSLGSQHSDQGTHGGPGACSFLDDDADAVPDIADNCIDYANPSQQDTDSDGFGNGCDADFNQDCVVNFQDASLLAAQFLGNNPNFDLTGDGFVNFADVGRFGALFLLAPGPGLNQGLCE